MPRKKSAATAPDVALERLPKVEEILARASEKRDEWLIHLDRNLDEVINQTLKGALKEVVLTKLGLEHGWGSEFRLRDYDVREHPLVGLVAKYAEKIARDFAPPILEAFALTEAEVTQITKAMRQEYVKTLIDTALDLATQKAIIDAAAYLNQQLALPPEAELIDADEVAARYVNRDW